MKQPTEEQIKRLPQWAQQYIHGLEGKVDRLERRMLPPAEAPWEIDAMGVGTPSSKADLGYCVTARYAGVKLDVVLVPPEDPEGPHVKVFFENDTKVTRGLVERGCEAIVYPTSRNCVVFQLVRKVNLIKEERKP